MLTGIANEPSGRWWTAASRSNALRMRACTSAGWRMMLGGMRTAESRTPDHSVSRSGTGVSNMSRCTPIDSRPAAANKPRSSSSERKFVGPAGTPSGAGGSTAATASVKSPSTRLRRGASQTESASRPPGLRTRIASASACSGWPTWLKTKLPTSASNAAAPPGIASNEPTRNGIDGLASAARRTIEGATSIPAASAPASAAAAARSPGPHPTSSSCLPGAAPTAASRVPMARAVMGRRNW